MTARTASLRGRRIAQRLMQDTCTISRPGTTRTFNPATNSYSTTPTVVYSGRCRVKPQPTTDTVSNVGEQAISRWPYTVSVPTAALPQLDDQVLITASDDPALANLKLRVRTVVKGTNVTARRLGCEEHE